MPWAAARQMLQVNVAAVAHLALLVLPEMRRRNSGHIVNVGSVGGTIAAQGVALHGGTKSFLATFSRAPSREMRGTQVHVSLVQAGVVAGTEFCTGAESRPGALRILAGRFGANPELIARRIAMPLRRHRKVVYVPWVFGAAAWVELLFGLVLDLAGPAYLRRAAARAVENRAPPTEAGSPEPDM